MINWCKVSLLAIGISSVLSYSEAKAKLSEVALTEITEPGNVVSSKTTKAPSLEQVAENVYSQLDFGKFHKLSKSVFTKAYKGFLNLKQAGQMSGGREILSVCDFSLSANQPRLWVIDMKKKKVLFNSLVAHGQGSGEEFATSFSNTEDSHQSSMGFFVTGNTYYGDKGYSLKLIGLDGGYNDQAFNRGIIIHGADYVSYSFIKGNQRLGRSWGCPSLPQELTRPVIDVIKGGTAVFIFSDNKRYLASSKWLQRNPPIDAKEMMLPEKEKTMLADVNLDSNVTDSIAKPVAKPKAKYTGPTDPYFRIIK